MNLLLKGAQIIDLMVLVVDINKGIQTQTAECLVIGEIICDKMLVVLNKIDLIPEKKQKVSKNPNHTYEIFIDVVLIVFVFFLLLLLLFL